MQLKSLRDKPQISYSETFFKYRLACTLFSLFGTGILFGLLEFFPKNPFFIALHKVLIVVTLAWIVLAGPWFCQRAARARADQGVSTSKAFQMAWIETKSYLALFPIIGHLFNMNPIQEDQKSFSEEVKPTEEL